MFCNVHCLFFSGTIIPFRVTRNTHFYNENLDGALHWWLYLPSSAFFSPSSSSSFAVREFKGTGVVGYWRLDQYSIHCAYKCAAFVY